MASADAQAFVRQIAKAQRTLRPGTTKMVQVANGIPRGPQDPGWAALIPPGEPDPPEAAPAPTPVTETATAAAAPRQRLVLSWARDSEYIVVGLEQAPDWDLAGTWTIHLDAVREMLPVLRELVKVKDLTGELVKMSLPPERQAGYSILQTLQTLAAREDGTHAVQSESAGPTAESAGASPAGSGSLLQAGQHQPEEASPADAAVCNGAATD